MKKLLAFVMVFVMTFVSMSGFVQALSEKGSTNQKETPIANLPGDNYVPYQYGGLKTGEDALDHLQKEIESVGGYVRKYASEDEYLATKKTGSSNVDSTALSDSFEAVMQTITVMTTSTGSVKNGNYVASKPILNALVRLDGVPRYTNNKGQIIGLVYREYVELFVERDGYNPYIEIMQVNGEGKTIHLKQPSDDIEIYSVLLQQAGVMQYINSRLLSAFNEDEETAYFTVLANIIPDKSFLLKNSNVVASSIGDQPIEYSFLGCETDAVFAIYIQYSGINSKVLPLKIKVFSQVEIDTRALSELNYNVNLDSSEPPQSRAVAINNTVGEGGFFGDFGVDFGDLIGLIFPQGKFEFVYDRRENKIQALIGYSFGDVLKDKGKWNEGMVNEFQQAYDIFDSEKWHNNKKENGFQDTIKDRRFAGNKFKQLDDIIKAYKHLKLEKKSFQTSPKQQWKPDLKLEFNVSGTFEWDFNTGKCKLSIVGSCEFSVNFGGMFFISGIPFYWEAGVGANFELSVNFKDVFTDSFNVALGLMIEIWGKIGAGIGFNDLLSAGVYGKLTFENELTLLPEFSHDRMALSLGIYYKVCALFLNFEGALYDHTWVYKDNAKTASVNNISLLQRTSALTYLIRGGLNDKDAVAHNIYQDASPNLVSIGNNRYLLCWLEDDLNRTSLNRTKLVYSILDENGKWGDVVAVDDDGTADFYPQLTSDESGVFVTWQNSDRLFDGDVMTVDDLSIISSSGEICASRFDSETQEFLPKVQLSVNNYMDTNPYFAVRESVDDPLTVLWQSNSNNDIFGTSGLTTIWSAEYTLSGWAIPKKCIITEALLVSYSSAFKNGDLKIASIIDTDSDFNTVEDNKLYIYSKGKVSCVRNNGNGKSSPKFVALDSGVILLYNEGGELFIDAVLNGNDNSNVINGGSHLGHIFTAKSMGNEVVFNYIDTETGFRQLKSSIYNIETSIWTKNISLTDGSENIVDYSVIRDDNMYRIAYVVEKQNQDGSYYDLICEDIQQLSDIKITNAYYFNAIDEFDNISVFIDIKNSGSVSVDHFYLKIEDNIQLITLENRLYPGDVQTVKYCINYIMLNTLSSPIIRLLHISMDNDDLIEYDKFVLNVDRVYYRFNVAVIDSECNQKFELTVDNRGFNTSEYYISIRLASTNEEIVKLLDNVFQDGEFLLVIDYNALQISSDTKLVFELVTKRQNDYYSENLFNIIVDGYEIDSVGINNYSDVMNRAKQIIF